MNFLAQAKLTEDTYLTDRVAACAASRGVKAARLWAVNHMWTLSAQDGWGEAYRRVIEGETITDPAAWAGSGGADPNVITDEMIVAGVTEVLAEEAQELEEVSQAEVDRAARLEADLRATEARLEMLSEQLGQSE